LRNKEFDIFVGFGVGKIGKKLEKGVGRQKDIGLLGYSGGRLRTELDIWILGYWDIGEVVLERKFLSYRKPLLITYYLQLTT
jgi:hypothetical protein